MSAHPRVYFTVALIGGVVAIALLAWLFRDVFQRESMRGDRLVGPTVQSPSEVDIDFRGEAAKLQDRVLDSREQQVNWRTLAAFAKDLDANDYEILLLEEKRFGRIHKVKCLARPKPGKQSELPQYILLGKATIYADISQKQGVVELFEEAQRFVTYRTFLSANDVEQELSLHLEEAISESRASNNVRIKQLVLSRVRKDRANYNSGASRDDGDQACPTLVDRDKMADLDKAELHVEDATHPQWMLDATETLKTLAESEVTIVVALKEGNAPYIVVRLLEAHAKATP